MVAIKAKNMLQTENTRIFIFNITNVGLLYEPKPFFPVYLHKSQENYFYVKLWSWQRENMLNYIYSEFKWFCYFSSKEKQDKQISVT